MKNTTAPAKVTIANADLKWEPRPVDNRHNAQCFCYQCEAAAKWTAWYMKNRNGR
jgi:hypothetical protein